MLAYKGCLPSLFLLSSFSQTHKSKLNIPKMASPNSMSFPFLPSENHHGSIAVTTALAKSVQEVFYAALWLSKDHLEPSMQYLRVLAL
jgi:hypothetical protein